MKKILLSLGLIAIFTFYAITQKSQNNTNVAIAGTQTITTTPSPTTTPGSTPPSGVRVGQLININGTIYLVKQDGLYGIPSMTIFNSYGYQLSNVVAPSSAESQLAIAGILSAQNNLASATPTPTPVVIATPAGKYKDGNYTGSVANAFYGSVQVEAVVSGGKLTSVQILQEPNDRGTSREIANQAFPQLISEAISSQSAQVDAVSGATQDSNGFVQSLRSALTQAS